MRFESLNHYLNNVKTIANEDKTKRIEFDNGI